MSYRLKKMARLAFGRILDIGFAAQPNPYLRGEVYGLDRDAAPVPTNYKKAIVGDAMDLVSLHERFDTIIAGELIEHLDHPVGFLTACYQTLNPGGRLVLSTPNPYHPPIILLECLMIRRFYYDPEHVGLFLPRFLVRLIEQHGFKNVRTMSGGCQMPGLHFDFPCPRAISGLMIYVGNKLV